MALTAAQALTEAKGLLSDPSGFIYTDEKMIPLLQKAYAELQTKMMLNGLPVLKEATAPVTVPANTVAIIDGGTPPLPTDLVYPIELHERKVSSTDLFTPMDERDWEPDIRPAEQLIYWVWREEELKFVGALTAREIRIRYMKGLTRITATTTPIGVLNSTTFIAARSAAIAAFVIGNNPTRAGGLQTDAKEALDDLLGVLVKRQQGLGVRRRVNRYRR